MSTYTPEERAHTGRKLARHRAGEAEAFRIAAIMTRDAAAAGVPETQLAEEFGVDRMTIRKWLGKR